MIPASRTLHMAKNNTLHVFVFGNISFEIGPGALPSHRGLFMVNVRISRSRIPPFSDISLRINEFYIIIAK